MLISSLNPADITPFPQGGDGTDPDDTADGWEGGFFLGASHAKNVTISGMGTIYGQGDKVFLDKNVDNGFHECPKFCEAFRPRMMLFEAVENFTVRDVTLQDAAFWTLHMAGCRHVRIQNIMILNDDRGANNDGIDPIAARMSSSPTASCAPAMTPSWSNPPGRCPAATVRARMWPSQAASYIPAILR